MAFYLLTVVIVPSSVPVQAALRLRKWFVPRRLRRLDLILSCNCNRAARALDDVQEKTVVQKRQNSHNFMKTAAERGGSYKLPNREGPHSKAPTRTKQLQRYAASHNDASEATRIPYSGPRISRISRLFCLLSVISAQIGAISARFRAKFA
jgi:hypothetical protein